MEYKGIEYTKWFDTLTDEVVSVLAGGKFPTDNSNEWSAYLNSTNNGDRVLGMIEFPTIDIELEAYTSNGGEPCEATNDDNDISLSYFVCIKGMLRGFEEWCSDDYAGRCSVDFSADDWEQRLEQEMCEKLDEYAKHNGYSFTEMNYEV